MALPSIEISNFVGEIQLSNEQYATIEFDAFVQQKYRKYLRYFLSDAAYLEVLDNDPLRGIWSVVMNGGTWIDDCGKTHIFDGMTQAIRYIIYSEWMLYMAMPNSATGTVSNFNENSTDQFANSRVLSNIRYNEAMNFVEDVYKFMMGNDCIEEVATGSSNTTSTFYDVFVDSTLYLFAGMRIAIDGITYEVVSVNENVSFSIDAGATGLDFTSQQAVWQPLKGYDIQYKELTRQW
jgi:hypothetical protein